MGRGLSDLQKHILHIAEISCEPWAYDLQVLGTFTFPATDDECGYMVTTLEFNCPPHKCPSEAEIMEHIRFCCLTGEPAFMRERGNTSANRRTTVSRALERLERRGIIKRYWKDPISGKSKRGIYELTNLGKTIAQDAP